MRAASPRFMRGHCRPYAEDAGLVGGCGDDPALTKTAHHNRFAALGGLVPLLDAGEEGVKVEMEHRGLVSHGSYCAARVGHRSAVLRATMTRARRRCCEVFTSFLGCWSG